MTDRRAFLQQAAGLCLGSRVQLLPRRFPQGERMAWWREARFGLFLHWGLYSILQGEWGGRTDYAEWIRNNAHIPLREYDKLVARFNPVAFDADRWVAMARQAGTRFVTLTSK